MKILKKLRTASLNSEFTGSNKKVYFNWKLETLLFCWGWIVLKFWKWSSCSYKIVLI